MLRYLSAALLIVIGASAVAAQNVAIIKERKKHYEAMGKAVKEPTAMYKGEAEFDLAKVQAALKVIQEKAAILPKLFPDELEDRRRYRSTAHHLAREGRLRRPLPEARRRR